MNDYKEDIFNVQQFQRLQDIANYQILIEELISKGVSEHGDKIDALIGYCENTVAEFEEDQEKFVNNSLLN